MTTLPRILTLSALSLLVVACSSQPRGRMMNDTEDDLVGADRAGAATFDRLIEGSVEKLLQRYTGGLTRQSTINVVFAGVTNQTAEELGEWRAQIDSIIDTKVNKYEGFQTISTRYVDAALREAGLRIDDLVLPAKRRTFLAILEREDNAAQAMLFGVLTRGTTSAAGNTQADYILAMELMDVATGNNLREQQQIRKEYTR